MLDNEEHTTKCRPVRIQRLSDGREFRLIGTGRWAKPGDSWLCAHDVLHHAPGDKGTPLEELLTYGVEAHLSSSDVRDRSNDILSVLEVTFQNPRALRRLFRDVLALEPAHFEGRLALDAAPADVRFAAQMTSRGFCRVIEEYGMCPSTRPKTLKLVRSKRIRDLLSGWLCLGYFLGKKRYPDPAVGRQLFKTLQLALMSADASHYSPKTLTFFINEKEGKIDQVIAGRRQPMKLAAA